MQRSIRLVTPALLLLTALASPGIADAQLLLQQSGEIPRTSDIQAARPFVPTGIGALPSGWTPTPPTLDGTINAAEWSNAQVFSISINATPVTLYLMNDAGFLYMAIDNQADVVLEAADHILLAFDDEGGASPNLADGLWNAAVCPATEGVVGFGNLLAAALPADNVSQGISAAGLCTVLAEPGVSGAYSAATGHMVYEMRVDLSATDLVAQPGENFGACIAAFDNSAGYTGLTSPDPTDATSFVPLTLAGAPALAATNVCYGTQGNAGDQLVTIDPTTGLATLVGNSGLNFPGLAISPSGEMFATDRFTGDLYRLDATTAQAFLVGATGVNYMDGIAFDRDGRLWGVDNGSGLFHEIDPLTALTTPIGPLGACLAGLAFDPTDGTAYASGCGGNDLIYTVNTITGVASPIGPTGLTGATPDIHFDVHGRLFGVKGSGGGATPSDFIAINKATGAGSVIGSTGIIGVSGLAAQAFLGRAATNVCYGTQGNAGDQLVTINPATGLATPVGNSGFNFPGLAVSPSGDLFATERGTGALYRVDAATAQAFLVGATGFSFMDGIAFDRAGALWGIDNGGASQLHSIDPVTAVATPIGPLGQLLAGLAFDPTDGTAYASGGSGNDNIYTVNTTTGAASPIGPTGLTAATPDIHFDVHGRLFGVKGSGGGATPSDFIAINKANGAGTVIGSTGIVGISGLGAQTFLGLAATHEIYGTQGAAGDLLVRINPVTGAGVAVGPTGAGSMTGLAVSPEGHILATSRGVASNLYRLDAATGQAYLAGPTGTNFMSAIAFDLSGNLWGVADSGPVTLYSVNPSTGAVTPIGFTGEQLAGLAVDASSNTLYGSTGGAGAVIPDGIYRVNTTDGSLVLVGTTGLGNETPDICFDATGQMFGVKSGGGGPSTWISIDKTNGAGVAIGPVGFDGISGVGSGAWLSLVAVPRFAPRTAEMYLAAARPNPFSASTELRFSLPHASPVKIEIFNVLGQRVNQLMDATMEAGDHVVRWSGLNAAGRPVAGGMYYVQMRAGDGTTTRSVVRIR